MPSNTEIVVLDTIIKFMRLSNGEDLISTIDDDTDSYVMVTNPMRVIIDADLDVGKQTIYMHNWIPQGIAKGNSCTISKKDIIFISELEEDIKDYYDGVVFDMIEDKLPMKEVKEEKEYLDNDKKVLTFVGKKSSKDKKNK